MKRVKHNIIWRGPGGVCYRSKYFSAITIPGSYYCKNCDKSYEDLLKFKKWKPYKIFVGAMWRESLPYSNPYCMYDKEFENYIEKALNNNIQCITEEQMIARKIIKEIIE